MSDQLYSLTAVILIGGHSSRMGTPKHLLQLPHGEMLYESLIDTCMQIAQVNRIVIVCRNRKQGDSIALSNRHSSLKIDLLFDEEVLEHTNFIITNDIAGPAAGILAAHFNDPEAHLLVIACDFPFIVVGTINQLLCDYQPPVTCFQNSRGFREPLLAIWSPSALQALAVNVSDGKTGPSYTIKTQGGFLALPADDNWLFNVNTRTEWAEALDKLNDRKMS